MNKDAIKKIAIQWLDNGANAEAMMKWVKIREAHADWEGDVLNSGKNPNRMAANRLYFAKGKAMAQIIEIYLIGWLIDHGHPVDYRLRQDVFSMAHQHSGLGSGAPNGA